MNFQPGIVTLLIFDEVKARAFYLDYLGFQVDWEYRLEEGEEAMQVTEPFGNVIIFYSTSLSET
jgi:hypothetical protein